MAYIFGTGLVLGVALGLPAEGAPAGALWWPLLAASAVGSVVFTLAAHNDQRKLESVALYATLAASTAGSTLLVASLLELDGAAGLVVAGTTYASSALVMGGALTSMITGHFYLVRRGLPFDIHQAAAMRLVWALGLKLAAVGLGLYLLSGLTPQAAGALTDPASLPGIVLGIRLALGIAVPAGLTYMILDCIARESNQSATGLCYILVVVVLGAEGLGFALALLTGVWL